VDCFLAQTLYPEHDLKMRLGWYQGLCGCFEDERKLFPCMKLMDDSLAIQATALPPYKQAVSQHLKKLPTFHRAHMFILGLQAPSARSNPSGKLHLK
jgi:hypothetical protein